MANFARIINDVAVDVSAEPENSFVPEIAAEFVPVPDHVKPQWSLVGEEWQPPPEPTSAVEEPLTWANAPANYFWIDVGPFFDRFGMKALPIASSTDTVVRGMMALITPRKYIDLKRADLPQLLDVLVAKNLITAGEKTAVLSLETTEYERHVKGLPQPAA